MVVVMEGGGMGWDEFGDGLALAYRLGSACSFGGGFVNRIIGVAILHTVSSLFYR